MSRQFKIGDKVRLSESGMRQWAHRFRPYIPTGVIVSNYGSDYTVNWTTPDGNVKRNWVHASIYLVPFDPEYKVQLPSTFTDIDAALDQATILAKIFKEDIHVEVQIQGR